MCDAFHLAVVDPDQLYYNSDGRRTAGELATSATAGAFEQHCAPGRSMLKDVVNTSTWMVVDCRYTPRSSSYGRHGFNFPEFI